MDGTVHLFKSAFSNALETLTQFNEDEVAREKLGRLATLLAMRFTAGGKVLVAGNGGSMADALHFAEELTGRFRKDRRPLPALALGESTHLTCVANDYGFEDVFSRLVEAFGKREDCLLLLSTSGNSANLIQAALAGRRAGLYIFGLLGKDGGELLSHCDDVILAPGQTSDRIQEIHMICLHVIVEAIEQLLENENDV